MKERVYDEKTKSFKEQSVAQKELKISAREEQRLKKLGALGGETDNSEELERMTANFKTSEKEKADIQKKLDKAEKDLIAEKAKSK